MLAVMLRTVCWRVVSACAGPTRRSNSAQSTKSSTVHAEPPRNADRQAPQRHRLLGNHVEAGSDSGGPAQRALERLRHVVGVHVMQDARIAGEVFVPTPVTTLFTSRQTLGAAVGLVASHYDVALKPGTSTQADISALTRVLGPGYDAYTPAGPSVTAQINTSYFRLLAVLVAVLAGLGVLNSVLMATPERTHDLGVYKALGMTPARPSPWSSAG